MSADRRAYKGPAILSMGFRPFFLAASLFGMGAVPVWALAWSGRLVLGGHGLTSWGATSAEAEDHLFEG